MTNIIGLFNLRSGSNYAFQSLAGLLDRHFNKTTYLGEFFNIINLDMWYLDSNNDLKYKEHLWKQTTDYAANLTNKKTFKNDVSKIVGTEYNNKTNIKNLGYLDKISSNYVLKFCPHHLVGINISDLSNRPNTIKILLKRVDLEDQIISFLFARNTGHWFGHAPYDYNNFTFTYNINEHFNPINFIIKEQKEVDKVSKEFKFDFLIKYEDLTGNPYIDFKTILNLEGIEIPKEKFQTTSKLLTKQEKIDKMTNYKDFQKDLETVYGI